MSNKATKEVIEIGEINLTGNIIPHAWYNHLKYDNGKPHLNAIIILADIVYWYRPVEIVDESTGKLTGYQRKFKADKLQRSNGSYSEQFGLTKKQVRDALTFLEAKALIMKELRTIKTQGIILSNVLFIGINPKEIKRISSAQVTPVTCKSYPDNIEVTPSLSASHTYTENTTETTTDILPSPKNSKTEKQKPPRPDRDQLNILANDIAKICCINIATASKRSRNALQDVTVILANNLAVRSQDIEAFGKWWDGNDWRGQKGQPPTPAQVGDSWGAFESYRQNGNGNGQSSGPKLSDEQMKMYKQLQEQS